MNKKYLTAEEVAMQLNVAKSTAYAMIRKWNGELEGEGYLTLAGRVPKAYFAKKCYGYQINSE